MTITINGFDRVSIRSAIRELQKLRQAKTSEACMAVAEFGARWAQAEFSHAEYDGVNDVKVVAEPTVGGARVRASGHATWFIEYGSGALRGYGHPRPDGLGPGTYNPASDNWKNPNGWYYAHGKRSWGNPPAAAMYHAEQAMKDHANEIVNGVFK